MRSQPAARVGRETYGTTGRTICGRTTDETFHFHHNIVVSRRLLVAIAGTFYPLLVRKSRRPVGALLARDFFFPTKIGHRVRG